MPGVKNAAISFLPSMNMPKLWRLGLGHEGCIKKQVKYLLGSLHLTTSIPTAVSSNILYLRQK